MTARGARGPGFSLTEVTLAIAVVALALLPILTTMFSANRGAADTENEALAVGMTAEAMEWTRAIGFGGWLRFLADGARGLRLPGEIRVGPDRIASLESKVTSFKSDDAPVDVDYPDASTRFGREIVISFVRDLNQPVRAVRVVATVRWKLDVPGSPERHVKMEEMLYGGGS